MMCPPESRKMIMHSTREDNNKLAEIPKGVITAEKWLRKNSPLFYKKISAWRNCKHFTEIEKSEFQVYAGYFGEIWNKIEPFVFKFLNVASVTEEPELKGKVLREDSKKHKTCYL